MGLSDFNTENFYKFLTTLGVVMLIFSIMYPMEKKNEIELKSNDFKKELALNKLETQILNDSVNILTKLIENAHSELKLMKETNNVDSIKVKNQRKNIKSIYSNIKNKRIFIEKSDCTLIYKNEEIKLLEKQINDFKWISDILLWNGAIFIIIGLYNWWKQEKNDDGITKIKIM